MTGVEKWVGGRSRMGRRALTLWTAHRAVMVKPVLGMSWWTYPAVAALAYLTLRYALALLILENPFHTVVHNYAAVGSLALASLMLLRGTPGALVRWSRRDTREQDARSGQAL